MNWRDYIMFVIFGFAAFLVGGLINQILGISGSQNPIMEALAFIIPLTVFYLILTRLRRS